MDELLCTGVRDGLLWLKLQLLKEYELETQLMGGWGENGFGVRPDLRHVRSLLRELEMENCRSFSTPLSVTVEKEGDRSDRPELSAELATKHRAAVARVVYLAQDRLDVGVAAVELAKTMAVPREGDDERLNRVARYLRGHPDNMQWYPVQEDTNTVVVTTDANRATCKESRRSNSVETLQLVNHLIAVWSRVHPRSALSSGEAELCAGMRGISEIVGLVGPRNHVSHKHTVSPA